jgi:RND family efflux transporter MFP subunit
VDEAEAMLKKTKESYSNGDATKKDVKVGEEAVKSAKQMRDLQKSGAEANMAAAQGGALVAHIAAKNATVTAPFAGIITRKYSSVGSFAAPGTPLYAISSPADMEISISVPGSISEILSKDIAVSVYPEGQLSQAIQGYIFSVSQAVGVSTQKSIVRIRFSDAQMTLALTLGQYVGVSVPSEKKRTAVMIPEAAILREYDDTFVFSLGEGGIVKRKKITIGESSGESRELLSGVEPGEKIVIEGQYYLRDGESVVGGK